MTSSIMSSSARPVRRQAGFPKASRAFEWLATALAVWVIIGVFVDVNAHNHGRVDDTFFTPWHFLLYSGVLANGVFLGIAQYIHVGRGYAWRRALPVGYGLSLAGVLVFALAGGFDFFWHEAFGFEANLEALLSPAHLLLAVGAVLFMVGPLRAQWGRAGTPRPFDLLPAMISAAITLSLLTMFTQFAHVMTQPEIFAFASRPLRNTYTVEVTAIVSVLIPAVLLSATLLLLVRRWQLPFGAITVLLTLNALLMFYLRLEYNRNFGAVLLAAPLAGLVGDALLVSLKPSLARPGALRLLAFVVPFVYFLAFFALLMATVGIWWRIHMWLGVTFMAGITGLGLSYLVAPPAIPDSEAA
jgi:hypothetical protein